MGQSMMLRGLGPGDAVWDWHILSEQVPVPVANDGTLGLSDPLSPLSRQCIPNRLLHILSDPCVRLCR